MASARPARIGGDRALGIIERQVRLPAAQSQQRTEGQRRGMIRIQPQRLGEDRRRLVDAAREMLAGRTRDQPIDRTRRWLVHAPATGSG